MFKRIKPCITCPFRTNGSGLRHLGEERAQEIVDSLESDCTFSCHDDIDIPEPQHCVGAMLILEKADNPNQMMRLGERIGFYDRNALVGHDEVFNDFDEWVDCQGENDGSV